MNIAMYSFGDVLLSRPAGKEAFLGAKAYLFNDISQNESIILDFSGIKVLTPSWVDEFISGINSSYKNRIEYANTANPSVESSLRTVLS